MSDSSYINIDTVTKLESEHQAITDTTTTTTVSTIESNISSEEVDVNPTTIANDKSIGELVLKKSKNQLKRELKSARFMETKMDRRIAEKARK